MPAFIDEPGDEVTDLNFRITGWAAVPARDVPVSLWIDDRPVPFQRASRPGLREALPQFAESFGIHCMMNVLDVLSRGGGGRDRCFSLRLVADDQEVSRTVAISSTLDELIEQQRAIRGETRAWLGDRLRCPSCGSGDGELFRDETRIVCGACHAVYDQGGARAIEMRTDAMRRTFSPDQGESVSSNPYEELAQALVDRTTAGGGWILDCGAGSRPYRTRHVVNLEIEDYFSTDVLAVGEALPFADNVFDAAVSLAVLEHVRDPFQCARELLRVVKPGGEIVCSVPFLQPVHGFPSHFYNMTREGLENLFRDGEVVGCLTPPNGHPILALQWFLTEYLQGLPAVERATFGSMTLSEAAALRFPEMFGEGYVTSLSPEAVRTIACLNTVIVRKRADPE
jgi:SAM-dependent methyltransferase